jgi:Cof subfamily protein (haloacid dehalogenase superfamily)
LSRTELRDPRQEWARACFPTACAGFIAQLRGCQGVSRGHQALRSITRLRRRAPAGFTLHPHPYALDPTPCFSNRNKGKIEIALTHSKQTIAPISNRNYFWGVPVPLAQIHPRNSGPSELTSALPDRACGPHVAGRASRITTHDSLITEFLTAMTIRRGSASRATSRSRGTPKKLSSNPARKSIRESKANKRLIATHAHSEIAAIRSKHSTSLFLTATQTLYVGFRFSRRLFTLSACEGCGECLDLAVHEPQITTNESRPFPRYNIPMPIKLIAMDLDGTLLDSRANISEENARTIAEAQARGIEIVLATGRRFDFARPIAEALTCDFDLIVSNGALIKSKSGATHMRQLLPSGIARRVLEITEEFRPSAAVIFDRDAARQVIVERVVWDDPLRGRYYSKIREHLAEVMPLTDCLDGDDPIQVMYAGPCAEMRAAMETLEKNPAAEEYTVALTEYLQRNFSILDVLRRGVSKGVALAEWARRRGIAREHMMAIGDNWNDREMLEFAGLPVVMGNSVPELKSLGWAVTLSNDQNGVAEAIRTYALGEKR